MKNWFENKETHGTIRRRKTPSWLICTFKTLEGLETPIGGKENGSYTTLNHVSKNEKMTTMAVG